jgi:hypothetical protein
VTSTWYGNHIPQTLDAEAFRYILKAREKPTVPALTDAEAVAQMKTQVAWTGKYTAVEQTVEGIKVTAHV